MFDHQCPLVPGYDVSGHRFDGRVDELSPGERHLRVDQGDSGDAGRDRGIGSDGHSVRVQRLDGPDGQVKRKHS